MGVIARFGLTTPDHKDIQSSLCTVNENVGDLVYIHRIKNGLNDVRLANPTVYEKTKVVGIIISKDSETTCRVQWSGETPSLFNNLQVGSIYFLGLDGKPTNPPPLPSETQDIFVNPIGVASDYDKIYIKPSMLITKRIGG